MKRTNDSYRKRTLGATSPSLLAWSQVLRMMLRSLELSRPDWFSSSIETVVTLVVTVVTVVPGYYTQSSMANNSYMSKYEKDDKIFQILPLESKRWQKPRCWGEEWAWKKPLLRRSISSGNQTAKWYALRSIFTAFYTCPDSEDGLLMELFVPDKLNEPTWAFTCHSLRLVGHVLFTTG